jgi:dGTPase
MVASYAVSSESSRGREHSEPDHAYRDIFQRDRDRVIHSRAFRRLENKTQVFTRRYSDHFRNRLTHTIEVAQISRTIAAELDLNIDLVETLALVHDIGHPPFGHAGERALDAAMRANGESFDHNLHALRIVEHFEQRYADFRGLNLSFEVREGIIKHSRDYLPSDYPQLAEYLLEQRPPLEAQLIDRTDEIAYITADLDDGLESNLITLQGIRDHVPLFERYYCEVEKLYPTAIEKLKFNEALKRTLDCLVGDLIRNIRAELAEARVKTVEDIRNHPKRLAEFSSAIEAGRKQAKDFLYAHLYYSPELKRDKEQASRVITEMFNFWLNNPEKLPPGYRQQIDSGSSSLPRVVCDYVAGMTDNFIVEQHRLHCQDEVTTS